MIMVSDLVNKNQETSWNDYKQEAPSYHLLKVRLNNYISI